MGRRSRLCARTKMRSRQAVLLALVLLAAVHCTALGEEMGLERSANTTSGSVAGESDIAQYTRKYGAIYVWHGVSAMLAWAIVAPLGHLLSRVLKRIQSPYYVSVHRFVMVCALVLTVQAWVVGVLYAKNAPRDHLVLTTLLTMCVSMQGVAALIRPAANAGEVRQRWFFLHASLGVGTMFGGGYILHHSMYVFELRRVWAIPAYVGLSVMVIGVAVLKATRNWAEEKQGLSGKYAELESVDRSSEMEMENGLGNFVLEEDGEEHESLTPTFSISNAYSHR